MKSKIPKAHLATSQRGVGLVEAIIGLFILTIILLSGAQLLSAPGEQMNKLITR